VKTDWNKNAAPCCLFKATFFFAALNLRELSAQLKDECLWSGILSLAQTKIKFANEKMNFLDPNLSRFDSNFISYI
jgi:hypothetical protein